MKFLKYRGIKPSFRQYKGNNFVEKAKTFSHDPLDAEKRSEMIKSSRQLVREVTKLLILGEFRPKIMEH